MTGAAPNDAAPLIFVVLAAVETPGVGTSGGNPTGAPTRRRVSFSILFIRSFTLEFLRRRLARRLESRVRFSYCTGSTTRGTAAVTLGAPEVLALCVWNSNAED